MAWAMLVPVDNFCKRDTPYSSIQRWVVVIQALFPLLEMPVYRVERRGDHRG